MFCFVGFVENPKALKSTYSIEDFNNYVDSVNTEYGGANEGWSAWYDRHTGLAVDGCSLDSYMFKFNETGTPFMPHGRNNTDHAGQVTDHQWTPGTQGWGLEMEGTYKYEYSSCYSTFDWCTSDTVMVNEIGWKCKNGVTWDGNSDCNFSTVHVMHPIQPPLTPCLLLLYLGRK